MHFFQPKLIQLLSTSILLLLPSNHLLLNFKKCQKITNFPKTLILTKKSKIAPMLSIQKNAKKSKTVLKPFINQTVPKPLY